MTKHDKDTLFLMIGGMIGGLIIGIVLGIAYMRAQAVTHGVGTYDVVNTLGHTKFRYLKVEEIKETEIKSK
jgi:hypothetical protein